MHAHITLFLFIVSAVGVFSVRNICCKHKKIYNSIQPTCVLHTPVNYLFSILYMFFHKFFVAIRKMNETTRSPTVVHSILFLRVRSSLRRSSTRTLNECISCQIIRSQYSYYTCFGFIIGPLRIKIFKAVPRMICSDSVW